MGEAIIRGQSSTRLQICTSRVLPRFCKVRGWFVLHQLLPHRHRHHQLLLRLLQLGGFDFGADAAAFGAVAQRSWVVLELWAVVFSCSLVCLVEELPLVGGNEAGVWQCHRRVG